MLAIFAKIFNFEDFIYFVLPICENKCPQNTISFICEVSYSRNTIAL